MSAPTNKLAEREKRKHAKRKEKRVAIAMSALESLQSLGYANTSLRDIASEAGLSLGTFHYYFEDKVDLISYCVEIYKEHMIDSLYVCTEDAIGRDEFIGSIAETLSAYIGQDSSMHRIWYDIRVQAMFDKRFRKIKDEVEGEFINVLSLMLAALNKNASAQLAYASLDGLFFYFVEKHSEGAPVPHHQMKEAFHHAILRL